MAKKIAPHFERAEDATSFMNNYSRDGQCTRVDPLRPNAPLALRVERERAIAGRRLFLPTGRGRVCVSKILRAKNIEAGSNGLGGMVYAFEDPTIQFLSRSALCARAP
eukprot:2993587-Pyramimonas_sp.AAC.1